MTTSYAMETQWITDKLSEVVVYKFSSVAYRNSWVMGDTMDKSWLRRDRLHWPTEKQIASAVFKW